MIFQKRLQWNSQHNHAEYILPSCVGLGEKRQLQKAAYINKSRKENFHFLSLLSSNKAFKSSTLQTHKYQLFCLLVEQDKEKYRRNYTRLKKKERKYGQGEGGAPPTHSPLFF